MKIRSITIFIDPFYPLNPHVLKQAGEFIKAAQPAFTNNGYEVQSTRLATAAFSQLFQDLHTNQLSQYAKELEQAAADQGYAYVSVGPALPSVMDSYQYIPEAIAETQNVFFSGSLTTANGEVILSAIHQCAEVIQRAANIFEDGLGNLRFAALANVPPGSPFFPAAYHAGGQPVFALATEAADLAVSAFNNTASLADARRILVSSMEEHAQRMTSVARGIEKQTQVKFGGIDFSLAPFPSDELSLGTAMERMGVAGLGNFGSLAAAAFLADAMDRAEFLRAGFSGLMLPVLEDATLARRAADGKLGIKDLLLYSSVCGTGLDCIPLPGDTTAGELYAVLLDLASLSTRLAKPLTARLLPIPGKKAGDAIEFDFAYFANSRVMPLNSSALAGVLAGNESFSLHPKKWR
jgi:uncharacterized protein (UPF0210 family)